MPACKCNYLHNKGTNILKYIYEYLYRKTNESQHQIISFGILLTINYPLFYWIWHHFSYQTYENLFLRLSASFFCLPLIFVRYWPEKIKKILPMYWYWTVMYSLPFFFTYMTLMNHASTIWLMNCVSVMFFVLFLFDLLSSALIIIMGVLLGYLLYKLTASSPFVFQAGQVEISGIMITFGGAFFIEAIFSHNKKIDDNYKLNIMESISASVAHELRTPLRSINSSANGIKNYLPKLFESYQIAKESKIEIPYIPPPHYKSFLPAFNNIEREVQSAFTFINMLLINVKQTEKVQAQREICSIAHCIDEALQRYPFDVGERNLIHWQNADDFTFKGDELLLIHVLFNLLKNALHYVRAAGHGEIYISIKQEKSENKLYFKDTGPGISPKILRRIFDRFFTKTMHGTGIGLAYCKLVMEGLDGSISCKSQEGQYTEFTLSFPKLP